MQDNFFTLTRVRLRHYRSIAAADVELGRLLLLVGPNGSGKSNFLDALRLLSEALQTSLDQALRARGGVAEVRRRSTGHPTHFAIDLEYRGPDYEGEYGFEVAAVRGGGFRISKEHCRVRHGASPKSDKEPTEARFRVENGKLAEQTEPVMPPTNEQRLYLISAAGLDPFRKVYDGMAGISVFSLNPDVIRQPQTPDSGDFLHRDGSNIASVLHRLERTKIGRADKARIEDYLQQIVPGMQGVSRSELGNWETLEFSQVVRGSKAPWRFQAQSVSDGTLRALGVLVSLFAGTGSTLSTIGIEEPESALHPAAAGVLLDALRDASERRQVIVTSHSPDLLDRHDFTLNELRAVRAVEGETQIGELDEAGAMALRENLYTPGELLRNDQLLPGAPR
ncbi:AAA family ATPase [Streptomyces alkaliterrae]|uniref:AAA family ATPase n=1 Tax=Streptomyces alkaliterrae TaxID=2213162 RepID=A0A5P0YYX7_9ACTN|nr:AAA family ATPase [Streptomyces alkaliterrae]MBB1261103.1 AAA family ATPase [Streptomyces alkaliterrae]MQS05230.1 AAA family ATPase [Streptomyces alkaliterrae]